MTIPPFSHEKFTCEDFTVKTTRGSLKIESPVQTRTSIRLVFGEARAQTGLKGSGEGVS